MPAADIILQSTIDAMQALHRAVVGVQNAPDLAQYPTTLDTAACPYVITWPGPGTWHHEGMGGSLRRQDRTMLIVGFLYANAQGDIPSRAADGVRIMQRLIDTWLDPRNAALHQPTADEPWQTTVEESKDSPHSDEGIVSNLTFRGAAWTGFQINLRVRVKWGTGIV